VKVIVKVEVPLAPPALRAGCHDEHRCIRPADGHPRNSAQVQVRGTEVVHRKGDIGTGRTDQQVAERIAASTVEQVRRCLPDADLGGNTSARQAEGVGVLVASSFAIVTVADFVPMLAG